MSTSLKFTSKPSKQEVSSSSSSGETAPKPKARSKIADLYKGGIGTPKKDEKIESRKADTTMPFNQIPREAKPVTYSDELKSCPITVSEVDNARKMQEMSDLESKLETYQISGVELSVFDSESLMKTNPVQITSSETRGKGSLGDPRMGVVENNVICATCGRDNIQCDGHFGYIQLNKPIYHPLFAPYLSKVFSSICITCGELYLSEEELKEKGILNYNFDKRLSLIAEESNKQLCKNCHKSEDKKKSCIGCYIQFNWNKDCIQLQALVDSDIKIQGVNLEEEPGCPEGSTPSKDRGMERGKERRGRKKASSGEEEKSKKAKGRTVPIEDVKKILGVLSQKTVELLGFANGSHPKQFILERLPVLPPISRQPKYIDGKILEDKLTEQYRTIIARNNALGSARGAPSEIQERIRALYDEIDKFIQGSESGGKGEFKSIKDRLQGKEERIRGTMMGRRVNFSARTVLGPKPTLRFGQIAVPRIWAKILRRQVLVYVHNRNLLQKYLEEGKIHFIFPKSGKYKGLPVFVEEQHRKNYKLQLGDNVERELMNGDYVMFNRQPTLHKQSMMGYQVVLHDELTIGLHIAVTRAHNADKQFNVSNRKQPYRL